MCHVVLHMQLDSQAPLTHNFVLMQKLSEAFKANDLDRAQTLITDLRYVTRTGEAIASKLP